MEHLRWVLLVTVISRLVKQKSAEPIFIEMTMMHDADNKKVGATITRRATLTTTKKFSI